MAIKKPVDCERCAGLKKGKAKIAKKFCTHCQSWLCLRCFGRASKDICQNCYFGKN